ncbi:MAG: TMEM175 family protein [Gammaproteobacteria bacterium]
MPNNPNSLKPIGLFSLDRCKALADGVFAIVVTLLVLGIDIPSDHNFSRDGLFAFLDRIGFHLFIYGISFWLAATYWLQHAAIMQYYRQGNRTVVWLNLLFLFPVTLLPFVTELKGAYRDEALVTLLFGLVQIFIGLALVALWTYSRSHPYLLVRSVENGLRRRITRRMLMSPVIISLLAIAVSFLSVHLGSLIFLSIPLYYLSHREIDQNWIDPENSGSS